MLNFFSSAGGGRGHWGEQVDYPSALSSLPSVKSVLWRLETGESCTSNVQLYSLKVLSLSVVFGSVRSIPYQYYSMTRLCSAVQYTPSHYFVSTLIFMFHRPRQQRYKLYMQAALRLTFVPSTLFVCLPLRC